MRKNIFHSFQQLSKLCVFLHE